jgi:hypothetical protein
MPWKIEAKGIELADDQHLNSISLDIGVYMIPPYHKRAYTHVNIVTIEASNLSDLLVDHIIYTVGYCIYT